MKKSPSAEHWSQAALDLLITTLFLSLLGGLFVAFCVLLGKKELLVLAYVLLGTAFVRSLLSEAQKERLEKIVIISEGMKIFGQLEAHYIKHQPRSLFYYLLFPMTGIWGFFFSGDKGKQELRAYWRLLQWILILLLVGGFSSYYRFYQHLGWQSSVVWLYTELLAIYFLCHFFAVPLSTSSIRLSIQQKRARLFTTTLLSMLIMSACVYVFAIRTKYNQLIPINVMLDQRLSQLHRRLTQPGTTKSSLWLLSKKQEHGYFEKVEHQTTLFLRFYGPQIAHFNQAYFHHKDPATAKRFFRALNKAYQHQLMPLAALKEHKHIFLTVTRTPGAFWGLICFPFRESIFYLFHYDMKQPSGRRLRLYRRWQELPKEARTRFLKRWQKDAYQFSTEKRLAQVVVEFMRDKYRRASDTLRALLPQHPQTPRQKAPLLTQPRQKKKGVPELAPSSPVRSASPTAAPMRSPVAALSSDSKRGGGGHFGFGGAARTTGVAIGRGGFKRITATQEPAALKRARSAKKALKKQLKQLSTWVEQLLTALKRDYKLTPPDDLQSELTQLLTLWPKHWTQWSTQETRGLFKQIAALQKRGQAQVDKALSAFLPPSAPKPQKRAFAPFQRRFPFRQPAPSQPTSQPVSTPPVKPRAAKKPSYPHEREGHP